VERFRRSRLGFGGVDPRVLFIPRSPGHTGLTGASHRSDQCNLYWVFARVNVWVCSLLPCVAAISSLGRFGARLACLVFWGFLAKTGLTGVLHRSDRCGAFLWKSPSFTSRDRCHTCFSKENQVHNYMHARIMFHAYSDIKVNTETVSCKKKKDYQRLTLYPGNKGSKHHRQSTGGCVRLAPATSSHHLHVASSF
jgi:hypothetical protein